MDLCSCYIFLWKYATVLDSSEGFVAKSLKTRAFVAKQFEVITNCACIITCCATKRLIVPCFMVMQSLLFSIFHEYLIFALLCICDAIIIEMKLLRLKSNKMRNSDDHIMCLHCNLKVVPTQSQKMIKRQALLNNTKQIGSFAELYVLTEPFLIFVGTPVEEL